MSKYILTNMTIYMFFYGMPLYYVIGIAISLIIIYPMVIKLLNNDRVTKIISVFFLLISIAMILYVTIIHRRVGEGDAPVLIPFHSFYRAKFEPENYRMIVMNTCMFIPIGITLPYLIKRHHKNLLLTVLIGLIFSLLIEIVQLIFNIGTFEIDDVICNSFGTFIGTLAFVITCKMEKTHVDGKKDLYNK